MIRRCSRNTCNARASATLTFDYRGSTAVLGPLALESSPGSYDLCTLHAERMSVPRGWEVIRLPLAQPPAASGWADEDDLLALANAVREVGLSYEEPAAGGELAGGVVELGRRGHLRVIADIPPHR